MENTAKNFALQLGALISLYISITSLLVLLFGLINVTFPDVLTDYWQYESAQSSMRFSIALLMVFFPTYLVLTRLVNTVRRKEQGVYLTLTKWLIYLSLLVGGLVLLGDLVVVINSFLNGEITIRFILKATAVLLWVGIAFFYYLKDVQNYWIAHEKEAKIFALFISIAVLVVTVFGFMAIDKPQTVRDQRLDQQQIGDLQDMQWRIEDYYRSNEMLPESLTVLYTGRSVPQAPENRSDYSYETQSENEYTLCAHFSADVISRTVPPVADIRIEPSVAKNILNNNWDYQAGETCFERVITDFPSN